MNEETYEKLADYECCNKSKLQKVKYCCCTCCWKLFRSNLIKQWIDDTAGYIKFIYNSNGTRETIKCKGDYTAKCPFCKSDNIIPLNNDYNSSKAMFKELMSYNMNKQNKDKE